MLSGLGYLYYNALQEDTLGALLGFGIVFVSIGLGVAMHSVVRMAAVVDANLSTITTLQRRHDNLEHLVARMTKAIELNQTEMAQVSSLVAASTETDRFPRLADSVTSDSQDIVMPDAKAVTAATINNLVVAQGSQANGDGAEALPESQPELREAFRRAIYAQDFPQAIVVGERIRELHPDSPMAEQYNELYEAIVCRVGETPSDMTETTLVAGDS